MSNPTTTTLPAVDAWTVRAVRYGAALIGFSALLNIASLKWFATPSGVWDFADALVSLVVGCVLFTLTLTTIFREHWRSIVWIGCAAVVVTDGVIAALHGEVEMFLVSTMLMMMGTGAIFPWSVRWQGAFNILCVVAWSAMRFGAGRHDSDEAGQWLGVLMAAVISQAVTAMRERSTREREQAERKTRDSEEKLRKVFEVSSDVITISGARDGRYIDVNPAFEISGYTRAEAIETSVPRVSIWPDPIDRKRFLDELTSRGQVNNLEIGFRARDGTIIPCLVSAARTELQGEECIITVSRDITHLKETERELIETRERALAASRAKSEFLSSMSHEIRTPLNAILGMAELLLETPYDAEQRRYLCTMVDNGNALLSLINDVLDVARVESGKLTLEQVGFDLAALVDRVIETLGVRAREKGLALIARIEPNVPTALVGDPLRLRQILVNLIGNATKFTERGSITLTVSRDPSGEPGWIQFSVTDTGIGIAPSDLEQVFATFVQADSSTARKYGGSGLGLSIAKRLVELMGGKIWAESELDRGSTFHFNARFQVQEASTALTLAPTVRNGTAHEPVRVPTATFKPLRILLADDSADNRMLITAFLKNTSYRIDEVENGALALEQFIAHKYDLVLMDIQMPVMDGHAATRAIRDWERDNHRTPTPIVALSAAALSESFIESRDAGCDEHVTKPIRKAALLEVIERATNSGYRVSDHLLPASPA
jgi:PAS domain S-box-containing protein